MDYDFPDPCGEFPADAVGASTVVADPGFSPGRSREDYPPLYAYAGRTGPDLRGAVDAQTLAALQQSAASGIGLRTLAGGGSAPPPDAPAGGDGSGGSGGRRNEFLSLIGVGLVVAGVAKAAGKTASDGERPLQLVALGAGLVWLSNS